MLRSPLLSMILIACACSSGPGGTGDGQHGTFSADIDGAHHDFSLLTTAAPVNGALGLSGLGENHEVIGIELVTTQAGTFPIEPGSPSQIVFQDDSGRFLAAGDSGSGTVVLTTYRGLHFAGTFEGMLVDDGGDTVRVVTNGRFDIDESR